MKKVNKTGPIEGKTYVYYGQFEDKSDAKSRVETLTEMFPDKHFYYKASKRNFETIYKLFSEK